jgi:hypothetical protein
MAFLPEGFTRYAVMSGTHARPAVRLAFGGRDFRHVHEQNSSDWVGITVEHFGSIGWPFWI